MRSEKKVSPRLVGFSAEFAARGGSADPPQHVDESEAK